MYVPWSSILCPYIYVVELEEVLGSCVWSCPGHRVHLVIKHCKEELSLASSFSLLLPTILSSIPPGLLLSFSHFFLPPPCPSPTETLFQINKMTPLKKIYVSLTVSLSTPWNYCVSWRSLEIQAGVADAEASLWH